MPKYIKKQTKIVNNICLKILDPFVKKAYYSTLEFNFLKISKLGLLIYHFSLGSLASLVDLS